MLYDTSRAPFPIAFHIESQQTLANPQTSFPNAIQTLTGEVLSLPLENLYPATPFYSLVPQLPGKAENKPLWPSAPMKQNTWL